MRAFFSYFRSVPFVERLIYYIFIPEIFARVVLELGLGMYSFSLFQQKLLIFYGIMLVEYIFQAKKLVKGTFCVDQSMSAALFFCFLSIHGLLLGIGWHNKPVKIATDTIPLLVAALNIVLAAHSDSFRGFSFDRLVRLNMIFAGIMVVAGALAVKLGKPSVVSLGGAVSATLSITIIVVSLWGRKSFGIIFLLFNVAVFSLITPNFNRTTLAFLLIASTILFFKTIAVSGFRLYAFFVLIGIAVISLPIVVPADSPLGRRLDAISSTDVRQGSGSIGERQEESAAIDAKIFQGGMLAGMIGFGHGAVYDMVFSNGYAPPDYSNAHFGWALFKLRYGYCGYLYLLIFAGFVARNIYRNAHSKTPFNRMVLIIGLASLGYIVTYMVFNIIASGIQFMHQREDQTSGKIRT
jgi:hypothetical protein